MMRADGRSLEGAAWQALYKTARWRALRASYLAEHPLCARCLGQEIVTAATVVHHLTPHKGDVTRFWEGPFEGLCKPHHDRDGQLEDNGKAVLQFDAKGWPI